MLTSFSPLSFSNCFALITPKKITFQTAAFFLIFQGGLFDDFLSHFMCCCCALVQELREVEIRGAYGMIYFQKNSTLYAKGRVALFVHLSQ